MNQKNIAFLKLDKNGEMIIAVGFAKTLPQNAIMSPDQRNPAAFMNCMIVEGEIVARPIAPKPEKQETGWRVSNCPEGSLIIISDVIGKETMAMVQTDLENPDLDFDLPDAGIYEVEVNAPNPYIDTRTMIEVENADPE